MHRTENRKTYSLQHRIIVKMSALVEIVLQIAVIEQNDLSLAGLKSDMTDNTLFRT